MTARMRWGVAALLLLAACAPRVRPLPGAPTAAPLPRAELPPHHQQIVFDWRFDDGSATAKGEGVARIAPPDSARLDLFLGGGFGGASAWLLEDEVTAPGGFLVRRMLPSPPLLWAVLGRLATPPATDTMVRVDGDTLHADIGRDPRWRVAFVEGRLARLARIEDGRLVEWVTRSATGDVRYRHESSGRTLDLTTTRIREVPPFDEAIWRR